MTTDGHTADGSSV